MEIFADVLLYIFGPFAVLAGLALWLGRDSRPGFDHRELRDQGPPNV